MKRWSLLALALSLLCLMPLTTGCGSDAGGVAAPPVTALPPNELVLGVGGTYHVGDEIRMLAVFTDNRGKQIPQFWPNHAYAWEADGLNILPDAQPFNTNGTMYARFRAAAPGTYTVKLTVFTQGETPSSVLDEATFVVNVLP